MRGLAMVVLMFALGVGCSEGVYCEAEPPGASGYTRARCPGDTFEGGANGVFCTINGEAPVWDEGEATPANGTNAGCQDGVPVCVGTPARGLGAEDELVLGCHCTDVSWTNDCD